MSKYKKWSQEELDLLIKLREEDNLTFNEIATRFDNRTKDQVNTKYNYLKGKDKYKSNKLRNNKKWTSEEIDKLSNNYNEEIEKLIELLPNRTATSIKSKITHLGYSRSNNKVLSGEQEDYIRDNYMDMTQAQLAKKLNVDRGVIKRFKQKEGLITDYIWELDDIDTDKNNFMSINVKIKRKVVELGDDE
ncbi:hypothetical protein QOK74_07850 [Staphylococcus saprophyticus]|uniref:hypothetical protein n=1 Tax=Staphylococcus saprophyticus TaxID=29385 RepID=UPI0024C2AEA1|nr:hypothetical protein [Staphylococcus saprophyticus]MDK1672782.1 hypothetical protein [Staphylococcus saprophyticus]